MMCFSCYDHTLYRMKGNSLKYNALKLGQEYLVHYIALGKPVIKCDLCHRNIQMRESDDNDGSWNEVEIIPTGRGRK